MENIFKSKIIQITTIMALFLCVKLNAQTEVDSKLKKLFFGLNIDSCQTKIEKEIENSKVYKFKGELDSVCSGMVFYVRKNRIFSSYKLENNKQSLVDCDSTLIQLQPVLSFQSTSHGKVEHERLYGHRVAINMYFSNENKAKKAYKKLAQSIATDLGKKSNTGDTTIDDKIVGNTTFINIDQKNKGYEFERNLQISIRKYEELYVVSINFEKLTIITENCD